jgi:hypothetical protein
MMADAGYSGTLETRPIACRKKSASYHTDLLLSLASVYLAIQGVFRLD